MNPFNAATFIWWWQTPHGDGSPVTEQTYLFEDGQEYLFEDGIQFEFND